MISEKHKEQAWQRTRLFWNFPLLKEPAFTDEGRMQTEIAAIDMREKRIKVNEQRLEQKLGSQFLETIESHEVGHYKLCPFSAKNLVRLIASAYEVTGNVGEAALIENLFADLVVNYHLYRQGKKSIAQVYQKFSEENRSGNSATWDVYMQTFSQMIGQQNLAQPMNIPEKTREDAKKLSDILKETAYNSRKWPSTIKEFAKTIKEYMEKDKTTPQPGKQSPEGERQAGQGAGESPPVKTAPKPDGAHTHKQLGTKQPATANKIPLIDTHEVKDFLPHNKEPQEELKGLASELGKDTYTTVLAELQLGTKQEVLLWFYRDLAESYTLQLPKVLHGGAEQKATPVRCDLDQVMEADIEYSIAQFGMVHAYFLMKWRHTRGNTGSGNTTPDLLIALDSSGSMPDPATSLSYAVLSGMIASEAALEQGNKVAVVNFSSDYKKQDFTNYSENIDLALVHYSGRGTYIPGEVIENLVAGNPHPTHVLIITDTEIGSLASQLPYLEKAIKKGKSGGTIFLDSAEREETKMLKSIGYDVVLSRSFNDLHELTLNKTRELYNAA